MTGLPALLGALGLVGILFGLLSFASMLFSRTGAMSDFYWVGANLVVGVLLLASAALLNLDALRERASSGEAKRAGKYGSSAILSTVLGIAILGMLGFLAERYPQRLDWSEQGVHTLSDQSQKVLDGLERDVEVTVLVSQLEEAPIRQLLDRYDHASDRFSVDYADPNERPGLLEQYGITPEELQGGRGLIRMAIGGESTVVTEVSESAVTNAMVKLTRTGEKVVYFVEGHSERAVDGENGQARNGYGLAAESLRNENYRVEKLLLAATGEVPDDADVVVLAGPRRGYLDVEYAALERYLERGGAVLALVDPRVRGELVDRLASWGVTLGDDVVIDRTLAMFGRAMSPFAESYDGSHEITRDLREPSLFHEVRSVQAGDGFTDLVLTGENSWAEHDLELLDLEGKVAFDEGDVAGPVAVAVAGTPRIGSNGSGSDAADGEAEEGGEDGDESAAEPARLAVYGDADFASNEYIGAYRNRDLFVNTVNWLIGDVEAISIRPNQARASRFQLTQQQFFNIRQLSLFVLPEVIAVIGVYIWWSRRHPRK